MKKLIVVVAFALSGCAGASTQPSVASPGALTALAPAHAKSGGKLVYVTNDANDTLSFYSYKTGKLEGSVTSGLSSPQGVCSDAKGNVFVANTDDTEVLEFAHGATTASKTIATTGQFPGQCAISSKRTLAVLGICSSPSCDAGALLLYADETGSPTTVTCPNVYHYYDATYDGAGNLYVAGDSITGAFEFCEVAKGSTKAIAITLNSPPPFPAPMHWDGKYIVMAYASGDVFGRYTISGTNGTLENTVTLSGAQEIFTMASKKVALAATATGYGYWKYPTGGNPYKTEQVSNNEFGGMALSPAPKL